MFGGRRRVGIVRAAAEGIDGIGSGGAVPGGEARVLGVGARAGDITVLICDGGDGGGGVGGTVWENGVWGIGVAFAGAKGGVGSAAAEFFGELVKERLYCRKIFG